FGARHRHRREWWVEKLNGGLAGLLLPVHLLSGASPNINPGQNAYDFVRLLQIVFHAKQPHVLCGQAAAAFGKRKVVIVLEIFVCATNHTLPMVSPPHFNFDGRWDESV